MVRCVVKTRRMIFVVKNYQVNVPIFFRVQLVLYCTVVESVREPTMVIEWCGA